jgi:hypothetical protein
MAGRQIGARRREPAVERRVHVSGIHLRGGAPPARHRPGL